MVYDKLYDFQKKIYDRFIDVDRFGLYLEMGLGKTLLTIALLERKKPKKVLIVCPPSVKRNGLVNLQREMPGNDIIILGNTVEKDKKALRDFRSGFIISSFQTVWRREFKGLIDHDMTLVIDEAHNINNRTSTQSKWVLKHAKKFGGAILLSGTPVSSADKWGPQAYVLGLPMSYREFEDAFCVIATNYANGYKFKTITGTKNIDLLHQALHGSAEFMKTSEAIELPPKTVIDKILEHDSIKTYNNVKRDMVYKEDIISSKGVLYGVMKRMASGFYNEADGDFSKHKSVALEDMLSASGENFIVFYNYNAEYRQISEVAAKLKIKMFEVRGQSDNHHECFTYGNRFIIAIQYQSGSAGIDELQHLVRNIIYYSPTDSYLNYSQSMGRIDRIGQKSHTFFYRFITDDTIEKRIYRALAEGKDYNEKVFEADFDKNDII